MYNDRKMGIWDKVKSKKKPASLFASVKNEDSKSLDGGRYLDRSFRNSLGGTVDNDGLRLGS